MRWLWIISVGVSDVQFPAWSKDDYGCWTRSELLPLNRVGIRKTHIGLLQLLRRDRIRFINDLPELSVKSDHLTLTFEHDASTDEFLAALNSPDYRISPHADIIPNAHEDALPLYCPKVEPLLPKARDMFGNDPVSVLVLNTRRADDFSEASGEPIASGPLIARYLAEQLNLNWCDTAGTVPEQLASGISTWLDVLIDHEAMEDPAAQVQVVARLNAALRAWTAGSTAEHGVLISTGGGMPPLKPLIERVPATWVGQAQVRLLDNPERREDAAQVLALNYAERVSERETLRFHCAEALRSGDYAGAYGLARRARNQPWAGEVRDRLGPLLELPGRSMRQNGCPLEPIALTAVQIETRLCMGDVVGALVRLGAFFEAATWTLIGRDARIQALGLKVDRENECLVGVIPPDHNMLTGRLSFFRNQERWQAPNQHRVTWLTQNWPKWLAEPEGEQAAAGNFLIRLCSAYNSEPATPASCKPRDVRNLLAHGADYIIEVQDIKRCLKHNELIAGTGLPFGDNFLAIKPLAGLLGKLGFADLTATLSTYLADTLNRVIEG
jgi:hypothetical protein